MIGVQNKIVFKIKIKRSNQVNTSKDPTSMPDAVEMQNSQAEKQAFWLIFKSLHLHAPVKAACLLQNPG